MFDLEKAVAAWRRSFRHRRVFLEDDLEELERHVRDHTAWLVGHGVSEKDAFYKALHSVGDQAMMEAEYRKVFWAKLKHKRTLLREMIAEVAMLKNYFKISIRNLKKHKGYSLINVAGLAVGLAGCILIMLFVQDELRYDRHHEKADRIYRMVLDTRFAGDELTLPSAPAPLARTMLEVFPEVEAAARLEQRANMVVQYEDRRFREDRFFYADSSLFDVLTIPFVQGEARAALTQQNAVVLTETMAHKYFGAEDPLGKMLVVNGTDFRVTGVVADPPVHTHFHYDFIASFITRPYSENTKWFPINYFTYVALRPGATQAALDAKISELVRTHMAADIEELVGVSYDEFLKRGDYLTYYLQPVADIHLRSHFEQEIEPNGDITYVYLFSVVAFLLLLIACVNFMNLATARSANRAREVGLRKVLGSYRRQLVQQFLGESVLLTMVALVLALGLVVLCLPLFNDLAGKSLDLYFLRDGRFWLGIVVFGVGVGLMAGSYPAFFLASFHPVTVLKGRAGRGVKRSGMRNGLVVFQFAISIMLIVGTLVVRNQLTYLQTTRLGFDKEHVVVIKRVQTLGDQREAFRQAVLQHANVTHAAASEVMPGEPSGTNAYRKLGEDRTYAWRYFSIDADYVETLGLELAAGRDFAPEFTADSAAVLLNETAAKALDWDDPVGQVLELSSGERFTVVGVVKDFHHESMHVEITPLIIHPLGVTGNARVLAARIRPEDIPATLAHLQAQWEAFAPGDPFTYAFLDQDFDSLYRAEQQTGVTFSVFAMLAILVACLGLFGLAAFVAEQRTKEIGVRKVLGASVVGIVMLLSRGFLKLVGLAFVLAAPVAYLAMDRLLQGFAYRIEISWWIFLVAGLAALAITLLTVSYQAVRAALADPVKALRYE